MTVLEIVLLDEDVFLNRIVYIRVNVTKRHNLYGTFESDDI